MRTTTLTTAVLNPSAAAKDKRVLVTGGGTFLGDSIASALIAAGAEVTLLVRPGAEDKLGALAGRARWWSSDVWNPASLRGRGRGHAIVVHTVGSMIADPQQGLTHNWLNFVSARNVANMCVGDGVPHMLLMSAVRAPWVSGDYIRAKRDAEAYMQRVGLNGMIVRAPVAYLRGQRRNPFYQLLTLLGSIPPTSWLAFGRIAPIPVDVLARGVAKIALERRRDKTMFYAPDLRRLGKSDRRTAIDPFSERNDDTQPRRKFHAIELLGEDTPFGWSPPEEK
ncbi:MAG: NAD(P)H-binding protein [Burkholderiales bacterium]|nr:NAD(P)H-binding protein [Anaerolineae bacterium]